MQEEQPRQAPDDVIDPTTMDPAQVRTLLTIMQALRTPGTGCAWDLEQSFATIAPYTLEEAYEVADAIDSGDMAGLCEELGDLLLQVVYHAQMAQEAGAFTFEDVVSGITSKMIRRHPHVFGDEETRAAGMAKGFWEAIKASEKPERSGSSALDGVPVALPALTRAYKLQAKAARVGFDWSEAAQVWHKIDEECSELRAACDDGNETGIAEEFGDLMFAMVNLGRHLGVDAESALRQANAKFTRRFSFIEACLTETGRSASQSSLEEMDALWEAAKRAERQSSDPD